MPNPVADLDLQNALTAGPIAVGAAPFIAGSAAPHYLRDAIVLRGYLADPQLTWTRPGGAAVRMWRIYLSARMDAYVDFTANDAVRVVQHAPSGDVEELTNNANVVNVVPPGPGTFQGHLQPDLQAVTLWLNCIPAVIANPPLIGATPEQARLIPRRYFIARELHASAGFVSGSLIDDVMESPESHAPTWPEQGYGGKGWPHTGYTSPCH